MSERAKRTPEEILARAIGVRAYHTHINDAGERVRVSMLPTHVPEELIPDSRRTNIIRGVGITTISLGAAGLVNACTDTVVRTFNDHTNAINSLPALLASLAIMGIGLRMMNIADERKEAAALMKKINKEETVFESPRSKTPQP